MKTSSFLHFEAVFDVFYYLLLLRPGSPFDQSLTGHIESQKWKDHGRLTGLFKISVTISHSLFQLRSGQVTFFWRLCDLTFKHYLHPHSHHLFSSQLSLKCEPLDQLLNPFLDVIANDNEADNEEPSISDANEGSDHTQPVVDDKSSDCQRSVFLLHCSLIISLHHSHSVMGEEPPSEGSEANKINIDNRDNADLKVDTTDPAYDAPTPLDNPNTDKEYLAPLFSRCMPIM